MSNFNGRLDKLNKSINPARKEVLVVVEVRDNVYIAGASDDFMTGEDIERWKQEQIAQGNDEPEIIEFIKASKLFKGQE